jgi:SAM-dependent MidA family methyltransferase
LADDVVVNPGEQDITASVNFTVLQTMGELAGLSSMPLITQEKFLIKIFVVSLEGPGKFPEWTGERRRQFQMLTHPEHLGRPFRVLQQKRG